MESYSQWEITIDTFGEIKSYVLRYHVAIHLSVNENGDYVFRTDMQMMDGFGGCDECNNCTCRADSLLFWSIAGVGFPWSWFVPADEFISIRRVPKNYKADNSIT